MFTAIDHWFGRNIFRPIAIKLCHWLKVNQYELHDYVTMVGWWALFSVVFIQGSLVGKVIIGAFTVLFTAKVAMQAHSTADDARKNPSLDTFFRRMFLFFEFIHWTMHVIYGTGLREYTGQGQLWDVSCLTVFLWLIGNYAMTIDDLPPAASKEPARQVARQKL